MNVEIANRLVQLRKEHNYSQEDLAEALGISRQAVSKWERAESSPDTDNLIALARLYKLSLDEMIHGSSHGEKAAGGEEVPGSAKDSLEGQTEEDPLPYGSYYDSIKNKKAKDRFDGQESAQAHDEAGQDQGHHRQGFFDRVTYPVAVTVIYLILGFFFGLWHPGWLIFLTIPVYYMPADQKTPVKLITSPVVIVIIYLILGFYFNLWHPGWLIFLLIPLLSRFWD